MRRTKAERKVEALGEIAVAYGALRFAEHVASDSPLGLMASAAADAMAIAIPAEVLAAIAERMFVPTPEQVKAAETSIRAIVEQHE